MKFYKFEKEELFAGPVENGDKWVYAFKIIMMKGDVRVGKEGGSRFGHGQVGGKNRAVGKWIRLDTGYAGGYPQGYPSAGDPLGTVNGVQGMNPLHM